jgi:hypothetical protein
MNYPKRVVLVLTLAASTSAGAAALDGSVPLACAVDRGHDCLPDQAQCAQLSAPAGREPVFEIDFLHKQARSPYRTTVLKIARTTSNQEALVLQGNDLLYAWSALINKKNGAFTISIADRKGAYVVFGRCRELKKD